MKIIYNILIYLAMPFVLLRLLYRSIRSPSYRKRWGERFAFIDVPKQFQQGIWVHAVSVGEVIAAIPLIKALQNHHPNLPIILTTMTVTGSQRVRSLLGDSVFHVYVPYDLPQSIYRFIQKTKPNMLIIMETELWPNMIGITHKKNIPIVLANARLSEKSMTGYLVFKSFVHHMVQKINKIVAQSKQDADRFIRLGVLAKQIEISGSIKFDMSLPKIAVDAGKTLRTSWGARSVLIAASTHDGEEKKVLHAFRQIKKAIPDALLILVPRHPKRFKHVAELCRKNHFHLACRSRQEIVTPKVDVYLGDTMGELMMLYAASDIAFVGGSLVATGGHNVLEPALLGLPIMHGLYYFNFNDIMKKMERAAAVKIIDNETQLAMTTIDWFENKSLAKQYGENAKTVIEKNRGALNHHLNIIEQQIP